MNLGIICERWYNIYKTGGFLGKLKGKGMDIQKLQEKLKWLPPAWLAGMEKYLYRFPSIKARLETEYETIMQCAESNLKPYRGLSPSYSQIPQIGLDQSDILRQMIDLKDKEETRWKGGFVSGAVYHGEESFIDSISGYIPRRSRRDSIGV